MGEKVSRYADEDVRLLVVKCKAPSRVEDSRLIHGPPSYSARFSVLTGTMLRS